MADMKEPATKRSKKAADEKSGFDPNSYADPLEGQVDLSKEEEALPTMMQLSRPSGAPSEEQVAMEQLQLNYKSVSSRMLKTANKNGVRKVDPKAVGLMVLATQTHLKNIIDKLRQISQRRHDKDKWTDSLRIEAGWNPRELLNAQEKQEREAADRKKKEEEQRKLADAMEKSKRRDKPTDEETVQLLQDTQFRHQVKSTNETVSAILGMSADFLKPREPAGPQAMDTSGGASSAEPSHSTLSSFAPLASFGASLQSQNSAASHIPGQARPNTGKNPVDRKQPSTSADSAPAVHVRKHYPPNPALTTREPRTITVQDVLFYLEQNAHLRKSLRLYNAYLRLAPSNNDSRS